MASNPSINLRLAVTGTDEGLRTLLTFEQGADAAAKSFVKAWTGAGLPLDSLVQRISGIGAAAGQQVSAVERLAEANRRLGESMLAGADVGGVAQDAANSVRQFQASEAAKQEAIRQTAAAEAEQVAAMRAATEVARGEYDALVASAERYRASIDPAVALEREQAEALAQVAVRALSAAEGYDRIATAALRAGGVKGDFVGPLPRDVGELAAGAPGASAEAAVAASQRLAAAQKAAAEATREDATANEQAAQEGAKLAAVMDRVRATISPLAEAERQLVGVDKAVASGALSVAEAEQYRTVVLSRVHVQQDAVNREIEGAGRGYRNTSYVLGGAANQFQDFFVQIEGGTGILRAFSQQAPQLADSFALMGGRAAAIAPTIGLVIVAVALLIEHFKLFGAGAEEAKKAADAQQQAFDSLSGKYGLVAKSADELVESYGRMTAAQQGLISANMSADIDKQTASLTELKKQLDATVPSAERAQHGTGFLGTVANFLGQGAQVAEGTVGAPAAPQAEDPNIELQRRAAQRALDDFEKTGAGADVLRTALQALALARGDDDAAARKSADAGVEAATAYKLTKDARDLIIAQFAVLHGGATQEQRDLVDTAEVMKAAASGAKAYADTLADLRERQRVAAMSPEDAKAYGLQKKGGLFDLQKQVDAEQDPDKKAALQSDMEERRTQLALEARATEQAEALAESRKKLSDFTQELTGKEAGLAQGLNKEAAARVEAEAAARRRLTVDHQLAEGGEAAIKQAGDEAAAAVRRSEAQSAATKSTTEAANQAKYATQVHQGLADAQRALTEAQQGGTDATREAIARRQAEVEVQGRQIALSSSLGQRLVEERTQTILLTQAAQDRLAIEKQLAEIRASGENSTFARDASGAALGIGDAGALNARQLQEAQARAQAVAAQLARMPDSLRNDEAERARVIQAETEAFNKQLVTKQQIAAVDLGAQERDQLAYAQQRLAAEGQEPAVREQILAQIEAENELTAKGIDLDKLRYDPQVQQAYADAVRRRLTEQQGKSNDAEAKRQQQLVDDVLTQPFKDLASLVSRSLSDGLETFETQGLGGLGASLTSFAQSVRGIGNQFASNLLTLPLNAALAQFQTALTKPGSGGLLSSIQDMARQNPALFGLAAGGVVGGIGGGIAQGVTGNPNSATGGTFGGLAGGVAGGVLGSIFPVVGTTLGAAIGAGLGTVLGSVVGSFFGGGTTGNNYNAMNSVYNPTTRTFTSTDNQGSQQNAEAARALAQQGADVLDLIRSLGLGDTRGSFGFRVGPQGVDLGNQHFQTQEEALQALIRQMLDDTVGTVSETLTTVLHNTRAKNAQELQTDIAFAATYDQLTNRSGSYQQALTQLQQTYGTATTEAERLGLDTAALAAAQAHAAEVLRQQNVIQIQQLMGTASPLAMAIFNLNQQFDEAEKNAQALGISEADLAAARATQVQLLRDQARQQADELTGQSGGYAQALFKLRDNFRQAAAIYRDLGVDTSGLPALQRQQEDRLRQSYVTQFEQLTGVAGAFGQTLLDLRDRFDQARQIANELGLSTANLAQQEHDAEVKAYQDAREQLQQQIRSQGQQVRSFVEGLVNPLRQALSGLGALAGFTSPQQALSSGLAEFRRTFALAQNDNVSAIQGLPQQAQQLLQLARQYAGSGPQFAAIFAEVQRDLQQVLAAQEARGNATLSQLPGASEETAQQQLDVMTRGFGDLLDQLRQLDDDWRRLGGALPGSATAPAAGAAQMLAAANQNTAALAAANQNVAAAQATGNALVADVGSAVRLGTDKQVAALADGVDRIVARLERLENAVVRSGPRRLGGRAV